MTEVKNEMTVAATPEPVERTASEKIDDMSITAQVKTALSAHRSTSSVKTQVVTRNGEVSLTGIAQNEAEKSLVSKLDRRHPRRDQREERNDGRGSRDPIDRRRVAGRCGTRTRPAARSGRMKGATTMTIGTCALVVLGIILVGGSTTSPQRQKKRSGQMKGSTRIAKGRIEEAAGALAGNDKLRAKGQRDQAIGQVKQAAKKIADKVAKKLGQ